MRVVNSITSEGLSKSTLIYGESKSGKTTQIARIAKAHFKETGKLTRYIQTEGGAGEEINLGVQGGWIQHVSLLGEKLPLSSLTYLARGFWPDEEHWPVKGGKVDSKILPWLDNVGSIVLDSITGAAELLMDSLVSSGRKISSDVVGLYEEEGIKVGAPSMSHYGNVQSQAVGLLRDLLGLPIEGVYITALETKGEDALTGQIVLGPAVVGKKLTGTLPAKVRRLIYMEIGSSKIGTAETQEYRAYFRPHLDSVLKKTWPADCRLSLEQNALIQTNPLYAGGYVVIKTGEELIEFFDYLDTLHHQPTTINTNKKGD